MISEDRKKEIQKQKDEYGHPIPEDSRKVLVAKRREGKTQELIDIAYSKIEEGKDVLWASQRPGIQRFTIDMFMRTNGIVTFEGTYNRSKSIIKFNNGAKLRFFTVDQLNGPSFDPRLFRDSFTILDNAALDSYEFNLITVNGELYDE